MTAAWQPAIILDARGGGHLAAVPRWRPLAAIFAAFSATPEPTIADADHDARDIQAALSGDDNAYARLVRRYERLVARRMWYFSRDRAICEELTQDVFVEAWFSLRTYRGSAPFAHWLRTIATRVGYRHWKRNRRKRSEVSLEDWDGPELAADLTEPANAAALLHALLARLKPAERLVLTLLYLDECGTAEIAARMGWSRAMVKMRAYRARKKLRRLVADKNLREKLAWNL